MSYQIRIVKYGLEPIDSILFHPDNWRIHPVRQQDAVDAALSEVGWVETVLVNLRTSEAWAAGDRDVTTLINGHMRVKLAAKRGETHVPVTFVDLDPEEESFVLTTLDPLGALAVTDSAKLLEVAQELNAQHDAIRAALRGAGIDIRENFAHISDAIDDVSDSVDDVTKPRVLGDDTHDPVVYANSGQAAAAQSPNRSADREKYPLAIVLDRRDYDRWMEWKEITGERSDTGALRNLLDKALEEA